MPDRRRTPLLHLGGLESSEFEEPRTWPDEARPDPPMLLPPEHDALLSPATNAYPFSAQARWGPEAPDVTVLCKRGTGTYGAVFMARNRDGDFALRVARNDFPQASRYLNEVYATTLLRGHDSGVTLKQAKYSDSWLFLLLEYSSDSILALRPRHQQPHGVSQRQLICIVRDIFHGLALAHRVGLIHRDVQPGSIFQFPQPDGNFGNISVALGDWGSSEPLPLGEALPPPMPEGMCQCPLTPKVAQDRADKAEPCTANRTGAWGFQPPELLSGQEMTHAADVWSAGMVILSLVQPLIVAELFSKEGYLDEICCGPRDAWFIGKGWTSYIGQYLRSIVEECLHPSPHLRPGAAIVASSLDQMVVHIEQQRLRKREELRKRRAFAPRSGPRRPMWLGLPDIPEADEDSDDYDEMSYASETEGSDDGRLSAESRSGRCSVADGEVEIDWMSIQAKWKEEGLKLDKSRSSVEALEAALEIVMASRSAEFQDMLRRNSDIVDEDELSPASVVDAPDVFADCQFLPLLGGTESAGPSDKSIGDGGEGGAQEQSPLDRSPLSGERTGSDKASPGHSPLSAERTALDQTSLGNGSGSVTSTSRIAPFAVSWGTRSESSQSITIECHLPPTAPNGTHVPALGQRPATTHGDIRTFIDNEPQRTLQQRLDMRRAKSYVDIKQIVAYAKREEAAAHLETADQPSPPPSATNPRRSVSYSNLKKVFKADNEAGSHTPSDAPAHSQKADHDSLTATLRGDNSADSTSNPHSDAGSLPFALEDRTPSRSPDSSFETVPLRSRSNSGSPTEDKYTVALEKRHDKNRAKRAARAEAYYRLVEAERQVRVVNGNDDRAQSLSRAASVENLALSPQGSARSSGSSWSSRAGCKVRVGVSEAERARDSLRDADEVEQLITFSSEKLSASKVSPTSAFSFSDDEWETAPSASSDAVQPVITSSPTELEVTPVTDSPAEMIMARPNYIKVVTVSPCSTEASERCTPPCSTEANERRTPPWAQVPRRNTFGDTISDGDESTIPAEAWLAPPPGIRPAPLSTMSIAPLSVYALATPSALTPTPITSMTQMTNSSQPSVKSPLSALPFSPGNSTFGSPGTSRSPGSLSPSSQLSHTPLTAVSAVTTSTTMTMVTAVSTVSSDTLYSPPPRPTNPAVPLTPLTATSIMTNNSHGDSATSALSVVPSSPVSPHAGTTFIAHGHGYGPVPGSPQVNSPPSPLSGTHFRAGTPTSPSSTYTHRTRLSTSSSTWTPTRPPTPPPPRRASWRSTHSNGELYESYPLPRTPFSQAEPTTGASTPADSSHASIHSVNSADLFYSRPSDNDGKRPFHHGHTRSTSPSRCPGLGTAEPSIQSQRLTTPDDIICSPTEEAVKMAKIFPAQMGKNYPDPIPTPATIEVRAVQIADPPAALAARHAAQQLTAAQLQAKQYANRNANCTRCICPSCAVLFAQLEKLTATGRPPKTPAPTQRDLAWPSSEPTSAGATSATSAAPTGTTTLLSPFATAPRSAPAGWEWVKPPANSTTPYTAKAGWEFARPIGAAGEAWPGPTTVRGDDGDEPRGKRWRRLTRTFKRTPKE